MSDVFRQLRRRPDLSRRALAPGPLGAIQAFVNTIDIEHERDVLSTAAGLAGWLADANLLAPDATAPDDEDLRRAVELREALRALLLANVDAVTAGDEAPGAVLEAAAGRAGLAVRFAPGHHRGALVPTARGAAGALGTLVAIAYDAMADGSWTRLKACPRDRCHCAFYDRSRNRSGVWCNMAICGSREKAATYHRRRVRAAGRGSPGG